MDYSFSAITLLCFYVSGSLLFHYLNVGFVFAFLPNELCDLLHLWHNQLADSLSYHQNQFSSHKSIQSHLLQLEI